VLSPLIFGLKRKLRLFGVFFTLTFLRLFPNRLALTYASSIKKDGVGAQAQRLLAIYSLAKFLGVGYSHSPIQDVAIHPLDPYQSQQDYAEFLIRLNNFFDLPNIGLNGSRALVKITLEEISQLKLLKQLLTSIITGNRFEIAIVNPYLLVDLQPRIYDFARRDLIAQTDANGTHPTPGYKTIGVHYRQGVGGFVIQNGEKFPRELRIDYFLRAINLVLPDFSKENVKLKVFSDVPASNTIFYPPADQMYLWTGTPRFENRSIEVISADLSAFKDIPGVDVEIFRGGDALEAIVQMQALDILILSKSSLSYVAALLAKNQKVIYPAGFWHPKHPGWIKLKSL
jgi:hypothetical protein